MKKNDFILIGAILIIAFTILMGQRLWQKNSTTDNAFVVITIDGVEKDRLPLNEDCTQMIELTDGSYNQLVIEQGQARVVDADCPDRICVKHAAIKYNGQSIVCLPHKVVVSIEGGEDIAVDTIAQ